MGFATNNVRVTQNFMPTIRFALEGTPAAPKSGKSRRRRSRRRCKMGWLDHCYQRKNLSEEAADVSLDMR